MTPEQIIASAVKRLMEPGKQTGAERQYAIAQERLRQEHNTVPGNPERMRLKGKYRA